MWLFIVVLVGSAIVAALDLLDLVLCCSGLLFVFWYCIVNSVVTLYALVVYVLVLYLILTWLFVVVAGLWFVMFNGCFVV